MFLHTFFVILSSFSLQKNHAILQCKVMVPSAVCSCLLMLSPRLFSDATAWFMAGLVLVLPQSLNTGNILHIQPAPCFCFLNGVASCHVGY